MFKIRGYDVSDRNYITKSISGSWLHHSGNSKKSIITLNNKINWFFANTVIKIVCFRDDPKSIVAFLICQPAGEAIIIYTLHVKGRWRRLGIATELLTMVSKQFKTVVKILNLQDEDYIMPLVNRLFTKVEDKSYLLPDDRDEVRD